MPSNDEHTLIGGLVGLICYLGHKDYTGTKPSLLGAASSTILGAAAGSLPDVIEPATSPQHRGLFHSTSVGLGLTYLLRKVAGSETLNREEKLISAILGLGYLSHLSLDSQTSQGLPMI
jgi:membrane-bound metal-dependent hydrolase YbcI (DUF457 family)